MGYTDCYAIRNKVRPNYLAYMLVQEILFFLLIIAWSESVRTGILYRWSWNNPWMNLQWYVIFMTLTTACSALALIVFLIRLKGIYLVREIEDIIIFDKSQRQELDFDSPATLTVFFEDIMRYESQQKYYKKSIMDRYMDRESGILGTPLQRVRALIEKFNFA